MPRRARKRKRRAVVDTSVLVAGIAGFRESSVYGKNPNADLLHDWAEEDSFVWLYSEDILNEYKVVLRRLGVRPSLIGRAINLIRERADAVQVRSTAEISPDPKDDPFCLCAEEGDADLIFTLNPRDFPQDRLKAKVVQPK
ncbi:MAG: PIN domain-containing protein [Edaphobacter sp.]